MWALLVVRKRPYGQFTYIGKGREKKTSAGTSNPVRAMTIERKRLCVHRIYLCGRVSLCHI